MLFLLPIGAILLHEGGHILALLLCGGKIERVRISPLGITLCTDSIPSYRRELAVALAGPFFGFVAFLLFRNADGLLFLFSRINLAFSLFNLLPIEALDGGKALSSVLHLLLSPDMAEKIVRGVSFFFLLLLWMTAVWLLLIPGGSSSLFLLSLWLFAFGFLSEKRRFS